MGISAFPSLFGLIARLFNPRRNPEPAVAPTSGVIDAPNQLNPRVLMIVYNPVVDASTGRKLVQTMGWNDPDALAQNYIADIQESSGNSVKYQIVQRIEADEIPVKNDGFQYAPEAYLRGMRAGSGMHNPDGVDYGAIVAKFNLLERVANDEFDEVWLFGGPFFGFWESTMAGRGAFFVNSAPLPNTERCPRRFVIMGFNYERGVGEMLEDLGHRAESTLQRVYRGKSGPSNLFERYTRYDKMAPGKAEVGSIHYAPNSVRDYDWGNRRPVPSCADDWLQFPNLPSPPNYRMVTCADWGNGDIRAHHKWWFKHLPKGAGTTDGIANNWWAYVIDPNRVK